MTQPIPPTATETSEVDNTPPGAVAKAVRYVAPQTDRVKGVAMLARSDIRIANVQVVKEGGETNLHAHSAFDGLWFVLKGRARFYTSKDDVLGEFGPHEGAFIPRGVPDWFESATEETLEILQVEAIAKGEPSKRIDFEPQKRSVREHQAFPSG